MPLTSPFRSEWTCCVQLSVCRWRERQCEQDIEICSYQETVSHALFWKCNVLTLQCIMGYPLWATGGREIHTQFLLSNRLHLVWKVSVNGNPCTDWKIRQKSDNGIHYNSHISHDVTASSISHNLCCFSKCILLTYETLFTDGNLSDHFIPHFTNQIAEWLSGKQPMGAPWSALPAIT